MKKCLAILLTMALMLSAAWGVSATGVEGTAVESGGVITVSGSVTSAVSGQEVTILVVESGTDINNFTVTDIAYVAQTTPDNNGAYSVSFTMPVAKRTGTYDVYVGATNVGTPDNTSFTFPTEAPTAPEVDMGSAKLAVNGANAFYYFITITLNDGEATAFNVKHYPSDQSESVAAQQNLSLAGISDTIIKVISLLKGIPDAEADRSITSTATLTYTMGGNSGLTATDTETASLNSALSN